MARDFAKAKIKVPSQRTKSAGMGKFPRASTPRAPGVKSRIYTKAILGQDPTKFMDFGFGDTGLAETPSIVGMARSSAMGRPR